MFYVKRTVYLNMICQKSELIVNNFKFGFNIICSLELAEFHYICGVWTEV